jgi:hypothetical protein
MSSPGVPEAITQAATKSADIFLKTDVAARTKLFQASIALKCTYVGCRSSKINDDRFIFCATHQLKAQSDWIAGTDVQHTYPDWNPSETYDDEVRAPIRRNIVLLPAALREQYVDLCYSSSLSLGLEVRDFSGLRNNTWPT